MNLRSRAALAAALIGLAGCGGGGGTSSTGVTGGTTGGTNNNNCTPGGGTICVLGTAFNPVDITISKNGSVTFQEVQGSHFIVFDPPVANGVANIGDFSSGTVSRAFADAGTYPYHCTIHGTATTGMHGTITVQ